MSTQSLNTPDILKKAQSGERVNKEEALHLWLHADFKEMGVVAHELRNRTCTPGTASYTLFRIINYTNICNVDCSFCSFKEPLEKVKNSKEPGNSTPAYVLTKEDILKKIEEVYNNNCHQFFIQGGVNPEIPYDYYMDLLNTIHESYSDIHIRAFSPVEVFSMAQSNGLTIDRVFDDLINAGLNSFPGAGAEILTERMRNVLSQKKISVENWYSVMKTALSKGLKASTNIVWGSTETPEEIIDHLSLIRDLQDETNNVLSFVPWTFQKQTKDFTVRHVPSFEYLKMIALSRIFLDNIENIEVSIMVKGAAVGELALFFGANDINSPVIEENVLRSYGLHSEEEAIEFIKNAGFKPRRRDFNFNY